LVKTARLTIIDPVLDAFPPLSSDEEEEPPDPEELRRVHEREKIRELKRRRVHGGSRFLGRSGLGLRKPDADAVFVREDQEDESAEVDIGLEDQGVRTGKIAAKSIREVKMEVDTPPTSVASPSSAVISKALPSPHSSTRNPKRPKRGGRTAEAVPQPRQASSSKVLEQSANEDGPKVDKKGRPRPDTYKQAWSVEEQHLLERLLEEIPDGEKNRWSKISRAMDGRRTARQVASRVQKYYDKLKRYGLDVGDRTGRINDS